MTAVRMMRGEDSFKRETENEYTAEKKLIEDRRCQAEWR